jgi:hypothetical protein
LPASLVAVLRASAGQLSQGHGVTVLATEVCLTPPRRANNVPFPSPVMDLTLALTEDSVHEVLWTQALPADHRTGGILDLPRSRPRSRAARSRPLRLGFRFGWS